MQTDQRTDTAQPSPTNREQRRSTGKAPASPLKIILMIIGGMFLFGTLATLTVFAALAIFTVRAAKEIQAQVESSRSIPLPEIVEKPPTLPVQSRPSPDNTAKNSDIQPFATAPAFVPTPTIAATKPQPVLPIDTRPRIENFSSPYPFGEELWLDGVKRRLVGGNWRIEPKRDAEPPFNDEFFRNGAPITIVRDMRIERIEQVGYKVQVELVIKTALTKNRDQRSALFLVILDARSKFYSIELKPEPYEVPGRQRFSADLAAFPAPPSHDPTRGSVYHIEYRDFSQNLARRLSNLYRANPVGEPAPVVLEEDVEAADKTVRPDMIFKLKDFLSTRKSDPGGFDKKFRYRFVEIECAVKSIDPDGDGALLKLDVGGESCIARTAKRDCWTWAAPGSTIKIQAQYLGRDESIQFRMAESKSNNPNGKKESTLGASFIVDRSKGRGFETEWLCIWGEITNISGGNDQPYVVESSVNKWRFVFTLPKNDPVMKKIKVGEGFHGFGIPQVDFRTKTVTFAHPSIVAGW